MSSTIGDKTRDISVSLEITASEIIRKPASVIVPRVIATLPILFWSDVISVFSSSSPLIGTISSSGIWPQLLPQIAKPVDEGVGVFVTECVGETGPADADGIGGATVPNGVTDGVGLLETGETEEVFEDVIVGVNVPEFELEGETVPDEDGVGVKVDDSVADGDGVLVIVNVDDVEDERVGVGVFVGEEVLVSVGVTELVPVFVLV